MGIPNLFPVDPRQGGLWRELIEGWWVGHKEGRIAFCWPIFTDVENWLAVRKREPILINLLISSCLTFELVHTAPPFCTRKSSHFPKRKWTSFPEGSGDPVVMSMLADRVID